MMRCTRLAALLGAALALCGAPATARPLIAITFDDLPSHSALPVGDTRLAIADRVIAALKAARVGQVYGFVNGVSLEREPGTDAVLAAWRHAGLSLGNHGWAHQNLDTLDMPAFTAEVERNEPLLRRHMGRADWKWFRYPFLAEGRDPAKRSAARAVLAAHGYRIAAVTMGFGDYAWNEPYARCVALGDAAAIARLEQGYLDAARSEALRSRAMAKTLYDRDIPYVLLMHLGAFDSRMLPRLLSLYRSLGFGFTSLPVAERDPAYRDAVDPTRDAGPSSLDDRLAARGVHVPQSSVDLGALDRVCR